MTTTPAPTDLDVLRKLAHTAQDWAEYGHPSDPNWHGARTLIKTVPALLDELAKTRAELDTMTAVAKSNKSVTQNLAQELIKALSLLADYVDGEYPHARAKRLLADNLDINATTAEPAERSVTRHPYADDRCGLLGPALGLFCQLRPGHNGGHRGVDPVEGEERAWPNPQAEPADEPKDELCSDKNGFHDGHDGTHDPDAREVTCGCGRPTVDGACTFHGRALVDAEPAAS